jgi:Protein of unknown function (DUF3592)
MMANEQRPVRKEAIPSIGKVFMIFFIGVGAILGFTFVTIWTIDIQNNGSKTAQELSTYGKWVLGRVVERSIYGEHGSHQITYEYTAPKADGTPQIYQGQVVDNSYDVGDTIKIIYSSRQPGLSRIEDDFTGVQDLSVFSYLSRFWCLDLFLIVVLVGGVFAIIGSMLQFRPALALTRDAISTSGIVLALEDQVSHSKYGTSHTYYVSYQYQIMGLPYELKESISKKRYGLLAVGSRVDVRYLPDRPDMARLEK